MIEWLRKKLKEWLADPIEDSYLDVIVPGSGLQRFYVQGIEGLRLIGLPTDGQAGGIRLIDESECVDKEKWNRLVRFHLNEKGTNLVWEDGSPF